MKSFFAAIISPFKRFDAWLFSKGDGTTLAVLRIVFASLAFFSLALQQPYLLDFYSQKGLLTEAGLKLWQWDGGFVYFLNGLSFEAVRVWHFVGCLAALCFAVGLFTRTSGLVLFITLLAFHNRNPLLLNSGDALLRVVILYLVCARSNATLSFDRAFGLFRGSSLVALWPQRLIALQVALVYFTATWYKFQGPLWLDGTATWYVSQLEELARFGLPSFLLTPEFAYLTTWGTLAVELALCTLVWFRPYRGWVLLSGVILHSAIEYQFNIPLFGATTVACYFAFYEGHELRRFGQAFRGFSARLRRLGKRSQPQAVA